MRLPSEGGPCTDILAALLEYKVHVKALRSIEPSGLSGGGRCRSRSYPQTVDVLAWKGAFSPDSCCKCANWGSGNVHSKAMNLLWFLIGAPGQI